jgi:hypothetical protein
MQTPTEGRVIAFAEVDGIASSPRAGPDARNTQIAFKLTTVDKA